MATLYSITCACSAPVWTPNFHNDGSIRHRASELFCQPRTTDDAGKPVSAPKRRRTLEQTDQARTCSKREPLTARDAASSSGNVQTDGSSPHQPRQSAPAPGQRRLLHYLRANRHRECAATAHTEDSGVEGHHGEAGSRQPEMAHPENVSPQEHGGGTSVAGGEVVPDHTGSPTMGHGGERRGHSPGWLLDLPIFFCSHALIALARSLRKCVLAVLITVSEANAVTGFQVRGACNWDTIPQRKGKTATKKTNKKTQANKRNTKHKTKTKHKTTHETKHHEVE